MTPKRALRTRVGKPSSALPAGQVLLWHMHEPARALERQLYWSPSSPKSPPSHSRVWLPCTRPWPTAQHAGPAPVQHRVQRHLELCAAAGPHARAGRARARCAAGGSRLCVDVQQRICRGVAYPAAPQKASPHGEQQATHGTAATAARRVPQCSGPTSGSWRACLGPPTRKESGGGGGGMQCSITLHFNLKVLS